MSNNPEKLWTLPCKTGSTDNVSRRLKSGPQIKDIRDNIRQKCRERIKLARSNLFINNRSITNDDCKELDEKKEIVKGLIREEIAEHEIEIALQEQIYLELSEETNSWIIDELEKEDNHFIEDAQSKEFIFCPICQKSVLQQFGNVFNCQCGIKFSFNGDKNSLKKRINTVLTDHNQIECDSQLQFFIEPNVQQNIFLLNVICLDCEYLRQISNWN